MKRLIASGCSLTYGHGLPDCVSKQNIKHAGKKPSELAWPSLVAEKLNRNCVNLSRPGASNKQIWHSLLNFDYQPDDIVIVYWSFIHRYCSLISSDAVNHVYLDINAPHKESKIYYKKIFTEYDSLLDFYLRVRDTDLFLKSQNIEKIIHMTVENLDNSNSIHRIRYDVPLPEHKKSFSRVPKFHNKFSIVDRNSIWVDMALDDDHPGIRSHQLFADQLLSIL
jgi:hypothetical protein